MSTRSFFHAQRTDGKWARIYCHSDGYWEHNGALLQQHYNSQEKAEALVALGDISSLGETIGAKHNFDFYMEFYDKYPNNYKGMASDPEFIRLKRMCNVYGRDRGEKNTDARIGDTLEEVFEDEEYMYVWRDGQWFGMSYTDDLDELRPLKDILIENNIPTEAEEVSEDESPDVAAEDTETVAEEPSDEGSKPVWAA
jgi:hypothetical protein